MTQEQYNRAVDISINIRQKKCLIDNLNYDIEKTNEKIEELEREKKKFDFVREKAKKEIGKLKKEIEEL